MQKIEQYSCYEFSIRKHPENKELWDYVIYDPEYVACEFYIIIESHDWFDSEPQARFAAIGHISLLENGEG